MSNSLRTLTMKEAIAEATIQAMQENPNVFCMGEGVDDTGGVFGTTKAPHDLFGDKRVFDTPLSEQALTGIGVGAAIMGMRPMIVHARCDFLLLTLDQLLNHAAKWPYMSGGLRAPLVVRAVVGRGWGQAAQHSQSLHALVAHVPGVRVVMPATPSDAKGMLLTALLESNQPTIYIEHRWLHEKTGPVPEEAIRIPIGKARIDRPGKDLTMIVVSQMLLEARIAAERLAAEHGIEAEIVDLRSIRPWDQEMVLASVKKTGRALIADTSWSEFGVSAEIASTLYEQLFSHLQGPIVRIGLPPVPTPCCPTLEVKYYPDAQTLVAGALRVCKKISVSGSGEDNTSHTRHFSGAF